MGPKCCLSAETIDRESKVVVGSWERPAVPCGAFSPHRSPPAPPI